MTLGSFRKFQADDYLMMVALCFYTTLIATINIVRDTSSNLLPPGFDIGSLTPKDIRERTYGSKLILVVEQCQVRADILTTH
jgi:cytosine/uracil/thiamine/allantoin permease